ncbi:MCE family protein [Tsukamurella serpentis]
MKPLTGPLLKLIAFAVITATATGLLGASIAQFDFSFARSYHAIFSDATMVQSGDEVRIAGVRVGQVTGVTVHERGQADVAFNLTDRDSLPATATAALRLKNLVGQRYLELMQAPTEEEPVRGGARTSPYRPGDTIGIERTRPAVNLTDLFNGFRPLFKQLTADDVNKLSNQIITVFQGQGGTVNDLLVNTSSLTNTIADKDRVIGELITNLTKVLGTINERDEQFTALLTTTQQLISGLSQDRGAIGSSLGSLASLTTVTESILTPTRGAIKDDVAALKQLTDKLNGRSAEVKQTLNFLPEKIEAVGRLASFGGWFQFYLCGVDLVAGTGKGDNLALAIDIPSVNQPVYTNTATRCYRDGNPR